MKLGITVSTYGTEFGPIIFRDGNLKQNIKDMKDFGYEGVDLFVNRKTDDELKEIRKMFADGGVEINTYLAIFLAEAGVKLSEIDSAKRKRDVDLFMEQIDKAKLMGANSIALGFIRGGIGENDTYDDCAKRLAESLDIVGEHADKQGIIIGLEPINRYELNFLNDVPETVNFIKEHSFKGVGILADTFHMNIEDASFRESILSAKGMISNIHAPGSHRRATGSGHLDYDEIFIALQDINYQGYITLEAFAEPDAITCAKQSAEFIRNKIESLKGRVL
jgi:sugar phosphate isomerase/epimerase